MPCFYDYAGVGNWLQPLRVGFGNQFDSYFSGVLLFSDNARAVQKFWFPGFVFG
ncbi:MAG: hypothetical protein ACOCTU_04210 [Bacteroidota bacterium]